MNELERLKELLTNLKRSASDKPMWEWSTGYVVAADRVVEDMDEALELLSHLKR